MPRHTETNANDALDNPLRKMLGKTEIVSVNVHVIQGRAEVEGRHLDCKPTPIKEDSDYN